MSAIDLRLTVRRLAARPGFSLLVIIPLGLVIGAATAVFSVVDQTLLRPAPFAHGDRLVDVLHAVRPSGSGGNDLAMDIRGLHVSLGLFDMLGIRPRIGPAFRTGDGRSGADRVVVISETFWRTHFGGSRDVLGRRITLIFAHCTGPDRGRHLQRVVACRRSAHA